MNECLYSQKSLLDFWLLQSSHYMLGIGRPLWIRDSPSRQILFGKDPKGKTIIHCDLCHWKHRKGKISCVWKSWRCAWESFYVCWIPANEQSLPNFRGRRESKAKAERIRCVETETWRTRIWKWLLKPGQRTAMCISDFPKSWASSPGKESSTFILRIYLAPCSCRATERSRMACAQEHRERTSLGPPCQQQEPDRALIWHKQKITHNVLFLTPLLAGSVHTSWLLAVDV